MAVTGPSPSRRTAALLATAMLLTLGGGLLLARALAVGRAVVTTQTIAPPSPRERENHEAAAEDRTPEIRGKILDADGNPVQRATVRLASPNLPHTVLRETESDLAGTFSFARVVAGPVRVVADHDPEGAVTSAVLKAEDGETTEVTLVLSPTSAVRGTVVDTADHPVTGAALSIEGVPWTVGRVTSGADGAFRIVAVPNDAAFVVAVARGYRSARVAMADSDDDTERVVRIRLAAGPSAEGDVQDADGHPVRALVVACEGEPSEARTTSAEDGSFQLPPSAIGCSAVAQHDAYAPSDAVALLEGRRALLRLKAGGAIDGVVIEEGERPVPSFTVGIESFSAANGRAHRSAPGRKFEDPRGAFRWDKLAPGRYVLVATAGDRAPARSDSIEVLAGAVTTGVRIVLGSGGSIVGHVYDQGHTPLTDVDLRFDSASSVLESRAVTKTDSAGRYRLDGAPSGPFTLRAQKGGFRVRMVSGLQVAPRKTITADIALTAIDGGPGMEFGGIGAGLAQSADGVALSSVFPGDPAERQGLHAGDRVIRVDGEETDGMSIADVLQRIRGEPGTSLGLTVERAKTGELVDILVTRALIVH